MSGALEVFLVRPHVYESQTVTWWQKRSSFIDFVVRRLRASVPSSAKRARRFPRGNCIERKGGPDSSLRESLCLPER